MECMSATEVPMVKIVTQLCKMQSTDQSFVKRLQEDIVVWTNFECESEYEEMMGQLLKLVYFGSLYECSMKDLLK
jgi:hypothetical protein